jgi:Double zinc ribbon
MEKVAPLSYLLCPKCQRVVPAAAKERYCPNDGSRLLAACPHCAESIKSPYSRFCSRCGKKLFGERISDSSPDALTPSTNQKERSKDEKDEVASTTSKSASSRHLACRTALSNLNRCTLQFSQDVQYQMIPKHARCN